jgi:hypothetical protein
LKISLPPGDSCPTGDGNRTITYQIACEPNEQGIKHLNPSEFDPDSCENTLKFSSHVACPKIRFFSWYYSDILPKFIVAAIFSMLGFFILFTGVSFPKINTTLCITLVITILSNVIVEQFIDLPTIGKKNIYINIFSLFCNWFTNSCHSFINSRHC